MKQAKKWADYFDATFEKFGIDPWTGSTAWVDYSVTRNNQVLLMPNVISRRVARKLLARISHLSVNTSHTELLNKLNGFDDGDGCYCRNCYESD